MRPQQAFRLTVLTSLLLLFGLLHADATSPAADALTARQQVIVTSSALTAKGNLPWLQQALGKGLATGLTVNEEKEVLVHLYAYCGFPRSINGLNTLLTVLKERKAKGITDVLGKDASPITTAAS